MSETRVDIMTRIVKGELGRGKSLEQVRKEFKERGLILGGGVVNLFGQKGKGGFLLVPL